jgi:hypothetical protein
MKKKFFDLILQIIPVMIGVYLGFAISNWGENQKLKSKTKSFTDNLRNEINLNREKLTTIVDYHKLLRDSSRHYLFGKSKIPLDRAPEFFKGIRTSSLLESAYNTGIQTGILTELDINQVQHLNQLYAMQKEYNEYAKITLEGFLNMDFDENEENIIKILTFMSISMADIVVKEEDLITTYDELLSSSGN